MVKLWAWLNATVRTKLFIGISLSFLLVLSFQNCAKTKFARLEQTSLASATNITPVSPICNEQRPQNFEYVACLAPRQSSTLAIQNYNVICQANGQWLRTISGNVDYSLCSTVCDPTMRPSDKEGVACPAPNANQIKAVQNYSVMCLSSGLWSRTITGAPDYSACPKVCDESKRPSSSTAVACVSPYANLISGVQNYSVTCNSDGTWSRMISGNVDYKNCPQSCDPLAKPAAQEAALCPASSSMNAIQNYTVSCNVNGAWSRVPSTFDSSKCVVAPATCSFGTRPLDVDSVACPSPNQANHSALQYYLVSCSGTTWRQIPTSKDESSCPRVCAGSQPAATSTKVACQSPFTSQNLAIQNYRYDCNSITGNYDKIENGSVDYSGCPKSCTGTQPSNRIAESCPTGYVGTAYRNYTVTCNTATGNYSSTIGSLDTSGCAPATCTGTKPSTYDPVACPSPFADRYDAKKLFTVTCVNGSWSRVATGSIDTLSCPVNDCSGVAMPSAKQTVGSCGGGASGSVTKTCSYQCTGRTYQTTSCTGNDYSTCDCGANATYDTASQKCIPKAATCVESTKTITVACGAGFNGGNRTYEAYVKCPAGPYGSPVNSNSGYNNSTCNACPSATTQSFTPTCGSNQTAVPNSAVRTTTYSCDTGTAIGSTSITNVGQCNTNAVVPVCTNGDQRNVVETVVGNIFCQYGAGGYIQSIPKNKISYEYCDNGRWVYGETTIAICPIFSVEVPAP